MPFSLVPLWKMVEWNSGMEYWNQEGKDGKEEGREGDPGGLISMPWLQWLYNMNLLQLCDSTRGGPVGGASALSDNYI